MLSRITTGTLRFDREVDLAVLPEHLAVCLRSLKASTVETTYNRVTFTAGVFRMVGNWNVLVPFGSGDLFVDTATCEVRYSLNCRLLIALATLGIAVIGAFMWSSGPGAPLWLLPFAWLWLVGGNLAFGVPRFRGFLVRSLASAPRKQMNPVAMFRSAKGNPVD
jgi:hypothetical protein